MAINVNTVYQTVLLILNKEQRGYMTPVEFNKIGAQVQLEIFGTYFESLNQQIRIPQTNTDYADRVVNLDEKIQIFKTVGNAAYAGSVFNLPTTGVAAIWTTDSIGATSYPITTITGSALADGITTVSVNGVARPSSDYTISSGSLIWNNNAPTGQQVGDIIGGITQTNFNLLADLAVAVEVGSYVRGAVLTASTGLPVNTTILTNVQFNGFSAIGKRSFDTDTTQVIPNVANNPVTFFSTITVSTIAQDFYRLGTVLYTAGNRLQEVQRVDRSEFYTMNLSPLTKPSTSFPIYLYENNQLTIYPSTIKTGISVDYIRKPTNPSWNFNSNAANNYAYVYDNSTSINFELHPSEQVEVILKTLLYAGVVIKDPTIIQVAAQQVEKENINQQR